MHKRIFSFLIIATLHVLCAGIVQAQTFPVQVTTQLTPPYSLTLSDYASSSTDRFVCQVFADIARPELQVKFRLTIEGQNVILKTRPEFNPPPVTIQGGVPERFTGYDLAAYFDPANLIFQGITPQQFKRTGMLPEGLYRFQLEVIEYNRGIKVSNTGTATAWLILNDPPIINLPRQNEKTKAQSPQNVVLQWTPRHTGSPNSAFNTEYEVKMVEVWPATRNPNDAILTSPPVFETTTSNTTIIYGPAETPLEPGRRYAITVRAKSIAGVDELNLFKNNGYSEVVTFVYGDACDLPTGIKAETLSSGRVAVGWEPLSNHTAYRVRYRLAGDDRAAWYENNTAFTDTELNSLSPNTRYEYQVAASCGPFMSAYSPTAFVTTNPAPETSYSCGLPAGTFDLDPSQLIPSLKVGDVIQAGDFDVKLASVSGSNGTFSGEGVIEVPYFNKAKVKASFTSISVNKDMRMVAGQMNVTGAGVDIIPQGVTDAMAGLSEVLDQVDSALADIEANLPQPFDPNSFVADTLIKVTAGINSVYKDADGSVVITDNNGNQQRIPAGTSAAVTDDSGNGYLVESNGTIHKTDAATANKVGNREYNLVLTFAAAENAKYGFDTNKNNAITTQYKKIENSYEVAWKSVAAGQTDVVKATLPGSEISANEIHFSAGGQPVAASAQGANTQLVTLTGKTDGVEEDLLALYTPADTSKQEQVLGLLSVVSYNEIQKNLIVVPVNGNAYTGSASSLSDRLNKIYSQAVVRWNVIMVEGITVANINPFDDGESGLLTNYTPDMKEVVNAYKDNMEDDNYYIFLVSNPKSGSLLGYMPRSKQAGFVFVDKHSSEEALVHTIAHELAHGAFNLQHTFSEEHFTLNKGTTDNLMDYTSNLSTRLYKYQWDKIRYPDIVVGMFEEDSDSEFRSYQYLAGQNVIPGVFSNNIEGIGEAASFVTVAGKILTIPSAATEVTFDDNGLLCAFTVAGERYVSSVFTTTSKAGKFAGFRKNFESQQIASAANIYKDYTSLALSSSTEVFLGLKVPLPQSTSASTSSSSCEISLYKSMYPVEVSGNWNSGGNEQEKVSIDVIRGKLNIQGGETANPIYGSKIKSLNKKVSSSLCKLCAGGVRFVERYSGQISSDAEYQALFKTAEQMCLFNDGDLLAAFTAETEAAVKLKLGNWLEWTDAVSSAFWARSDAWQIYHKKLNLFLDIYYTLKSNSSLSTLPNNKIKAIVNARTEEFLNLYTVEERIALIKNLLPEPKTGNFNNYAELYVSNSEENAILKVLRSVKSKPDAITFLAGISTGRFLQKLNFHIDDFGLGGDNYTNLSKQFQRLTLLKNGVDASVPISTAQWRELIPENQHFTYNDTRTFSFGSVKPEDGAVYYKSVTYDENGNLTIQFEVCEGVLVSYREQNAGHGETYTIKTVSCEKEMPYQRNLQYFDLISINVIDLDFLPASVNDNVGDGYVTYAGYLDYIEEKKGTEQVSKIADYSLTTASLVFGVGEVALLIRGGATTGRIMLASLDVGTELASLILETDEFGKLICGSGYTEENECQALKDLKMATTLAQIGAIVTSGYDIAKNWNAIKAAKVTDNVGSIRLVERATSLDVSTLNKLKSAVGEQKTILLGSNVLHTPKTFLDEVGSNLVDLTIDSKYYVKYDVTNGRLFFGSANGSSYYAYVQEATVPTGLVNDQAIRTHLVETVNKLKNLVGQGGVRSIRLLDKPVNTNPAKVTTILGRYVPDVSSLFSELGNFKNMDLGEVPGGINILNRPDDYARIGQWWPDHNLPWLKSAVDRGDDINLATLPINKEEVFDLVTNTPKGAFAQELQYLVQRDYKPGNVNDADWLKIKGWLNGSSPYVNSLLNKDIRKAIVDLAESRTVAQKYFNRIKQNPTIHISDYTLHLDDFETWYTSVFKSDLFEAHHMIPKNVLRDNLNLQQILNWAKSNNKIWDFGGIDNGIMLQKRKMNTVGEVVGDHANHPNYDIQISRKIDNIFAQNNGNMAEAFDDVLDFVNDLRDQLNRDVVDGNFIVNNLVIP